MVKTPTAWLAHLEEENAEEDDEVHSEDPDGINVSWRSPWLCLARAVKDA